MIQRTLGAIEKMVNGSLLRGDRELMIHGVSIDSRSLLPGQLFIPIVGERFNGHSYLKMAMEKGAVAALWQRGEPLPEVDFPFIQVEDTVQALQQLAASYRRERPLTIIGITGSNGKTSTKDILAALLGTTYRTHKTQGNLNNHLGVPLTLLAMAEDTEMGVVEMGMDHLGEISLLTRLAQPDVAIITNIGEAHLEALETKEAIFQAKLEILEGLKPGGLFLYNGADAYLKNITPEMVKDFQVIAFNSQGVYEPKLQGIENQGIRFTLKETGDTPLWLPMLGKHQMINCAGAIAIAQHLGVPTEKIPQGLRAVEATGARNQLVELGALAILDDSYKSNPLSLQAALETLYSLGGYQQRVAVLSDMNGLGKNAIDFHRQVVAHLDPNQLDYLLTMGPLSQAMAEEAQKKFPPGRVIHTQDIEELQENLKGILVPGAVVLVKGSREQELERVVAFLKKEPLTLERKEQ